MTARGRRFLARLVTMLVAGLAGILTVGVLPAAADTVGIGQYVALGAPCRGTGRERAR